MLALAFCMQAGDGDGEEALVNRAHVGDGTSGVDSTQHYDMEMELLAWQDNTALRRAPSGQVGVELISKTRILGTPEHSDPVGLIKQRRRLFEEGSAGEGGAQDRAGQMHGHASGDVRRLLCGRMTGARSHAPMQ